MPPSRRRHLSVAFSLAAIASGMVMLTYASVPLYRLFCQVTGFAGTTQVGTETDEIAVLDRVIDVTFDAEVDPKLPWDFHPEMRQISAKVGERQLAIFEATNRGKEPITGTAVYNVTPHGAGPYFKKVQCFCFDRQTIRPGETVHLPVSFYIDPAIARDRDMEEVTNIALSYTFFPAANP